MLKATQTFALSLAAIVLASSCGSSRAPLSSAVSSADTTEATPETAAAENSLGTTATDAPTDVLVETMTQFVADTPGGVEVLRVRDGISQRAAVGTATSDGEALASGSVFRVGSVSKPFVAVMVLQLVDDGIVDLDATLSTYIPDATIGANATVRQLLSHQSGIANYTDQPAFFTDVLADRSRRLTPSEILDYVVGVPAGTVGEFAYSNTNYILLGQLVEAIDGTDLNASLLARITGPAGLDNTTFDTGGGLEIPSLVGSWSWAGDSGDPTSPYASIASSAWAAGSLVSTADDLAGFLDALAGGQLVSSESLAAMTDTGATGYGLGLVAVSFSPTEPGFGHSGSIIGFTSTMAINPATGDKLVILTNNDELVADQLAFQILSAE